MLYFFALFRRLSRNRASESRLERLSAFSAEPL
ncbi:hypothetical protein RHECNPAF_4310071 [Rhizobium etli CNPAF512]|nr:hypothetical protein RHECNPAF_4310071 [Rhizobium etli CNPAF512]